MVFAVVSLVHKRASKGWVTPALSALIPSVAIALLTAFAVFGNTGSSDGGLQLLEVGKHYFYHLSLNPLNQQLGGLQIGFGLAVKLLIANALICVLGFLCARSNQRVLVTFFILYFLGNGLLLSLGRSHMSIDTVSSWRYQYGVLLCFAPVVAIILDRLLCFIPVFGIRLLPQLFILWWVSGTVYDHWQYHSPVWSEFRGTEIRKALAAPEMDPHSSRISSLEGVNDSRVIELIEKYNLH